MIIIIIIIIIIITVIVIIIIIILLHREIDFAHILILTLEALYLD